MAIPLRPESARNPMMNVEKFETLVDLQLRKSYPMLDLDEMHDKSDRTLLYGVTIDCHCWHVYMKNGTIWVVSYQFVGGEHTHKLINDFALIDRGRADVVIPNKRLNPERCDFDFCKLLISKGLVLPFTAYDDKAESVFRGKKFVGKTREDFGKF